MKTGDVWQDKRIIYAGLATVLIVAIAFFSQSINQIIWLGLSAGLQQMGTIFTIDQLANIGNVILATMISAMGWHIGLTVLLYLAFFTLGIVLIILYRRALKASAVPARWFDYLFLVTTGCMSVLPLVVLFTSVGVFGFYVLTTVQAFNNLSAISIEPLISAWNTLTDLIANFTFTRENIEIIATLIPEISTAIANFGDVVVIWNQTTDFFNQLQVINSWLEISKFIGLTLILLADAGIIYVVVQHLPNSPLPTVQIVPRPTPPVSTDEN